MRGEGEGFRGIWKVRGVCASERECVLFFVYGELRTG